MKIVCISDMHGMLPLLPECDLLLIAGDVCPPPYWPVNEAIERQARWLNDVFRSWLESTKCKAIVGIAGNHDVVFESFPPSLSWIYLQDSGVNWGGLKIWGTPWSKWIITPWPYEWAFGAEDTEQQYRFTKIPIDVDILVSHAPPLSILDETNNGIHAGSEVLLDRIKHLPNLKMHVFGHIHEAAGMKEVDGKVFVNACKGWMVEA